MQENKQEKSQIKQNILLYLSKKGVSTYEFYKKTGITRGILQQNNGISEDNIARFLAYAHDVSPEWLLTGRGDMLRPSAPTPSTSDPLQAESATENDAAPTPSTSDPLQAESATENDAAPSPSTTEEDAAPSQAESSSIAQSRVTIHERIGELVMKFGNGKNTVLAAKIGVSEGNIRGYIKDVMPKQDVLEKIATCLDVSPDWLLTGRGDMLRPSTHTPSSSAPLQAESATEKDAAPATHTTSAILASNSATAIPLVTEQAAAGFGSAHFSITEADVKAYYVIPKFKHCHVDFMIEISGSSMYPKYNSGDVVACTIIHESKFLQWNKCHIIATTEQGILCKRLRKSEHTDCITAVSDNRDYPPFDIPTSEITGIAIVVGVIRLE